MLSLLSACGVQLDLGAPYGPTISRGGFGDGNSNNSTNNNSTPPAGLIFEDLFNIAGDRVTGGTDWLEVTIPGLGVLEHPIAAGGAVQPPAALPMAGIWANPSSIDLEYSYQEMEMIAPSVTGTGSLAFFAARFNRATYVGYSCVLSVDGGTGFYEVQIARVDVGPVVTPVNTSGSSVLTAVDSVAQAGTPFLFGCETVQVGANDVIRAYFGANTSAAPTMVVDYVIGTHASDGTPLTGLEAGFGFQQGAAPDDHLINSYRIYGEYPH